MDMFFVTEHELLPRHLYVHATIVTPDSTSVNMKLLGLIRA